MRGAIYNTYEYTLAAGEKVKLSRRFSFVTCLSATAAFEIGIHGDTFGESDFGEFEAGLTYHASPGEVMAGMTLYNTSGASNTIKLAVGVGNVTDARLTVTGTLNVSQADTTLPRAATPGTWTDNAAQTISAGAAAQVLAANSGRREAVVSNDGDAALYVRGSNTAAPAGVKLAAGQTVFLTTTAAVYVYNPDAAGQDVLASEIEW